MLPSAQRSVPEALQQGLGGVPDARAETTQQLEDALLELYNLLESYAPSWYTQEHHNRAESALRSVRSS
jgi:hypothetical protein